MWNILFLIIGLIIILIGINFVMNNNNSTDNTIVQQDLHNTESIKGIRVKVSLDEIFNKIIPSQKIDLVAILSSSKQILWSDEVQVHLSSEYYYVNEYILVLRNPTEVNFHDIFLYEKEVTERFEFILKRKNIFVSFTDTDNNPINTTLVYSFQYTYAIVAAFLGIAVLLFIYIKFFKRPK